MDFIIIMANERLEGDSALSIWHQARLAVQDSMVGVDILVFSESDWEKWHTSCHHILETCQREGDFYMNPEPEHATFGLKDFKALQCMQSDPETFEDAIFGFHAQQCFEKFLKAALSQLGQDYPHTHDLHLLWRQLKQVASLPRA